MSLRISQVIATVFGIGYIQKGAGTVAALLGAALCLLAGGMPGAQMDIFILSMAVLALGVWVSALVEPVWGKDSNKVVIDELAGMMITLTFLPLSWVNITIGFLLFRAFDIVKPFGIRKTERLPSGWGVMADDVLAALYAHIVLRLLVYHHII